MRYHIELKVNGVWQYQDYAGTERMAGLIATVLCASLKAFNPSVRIRDTDTDSIIEIGDIA